MSSESTDFRRIVRTVGIFFLGYALPYGIYKVSRILDFDYRETLAVIAGDSPARLISHLVSYFGMSWVTTVYIATFVYPLIGVVRYIARSWVRSGYGDPLDRLRRAIDRRADWTRIILSLPSITWMAMALSFVAGRFGRGFRTHSLSLFEQSKASFTYVALGALLTVAAVAYAQFNVSRRGLRALVAPTLRSGETSRFDITENEIRFDAVAVTWEARASVALVALMSLAMFAYVRMTKYTPNFGIMMSYAAVTLGSAYAFTKQSRIAVGLDGVLVYGTSRTKFFAYRDIDEAKGWGAVIVLFKKGRVALRLQLHGEDLLRREAILERISESIERAKREQHAPTVAYVASASKDDLMRAAEGASDYRRTAVSRAQLWEVIEGPAIVASARVAAAEALSTSIDDSERVRLRLAAEHCAESHVRFALEKLVDGNSIDGNSEEEAVNPDGKRARMA